MNKTWWADNFWNRVKSSEQLKFAILHHRDVFAQNGVKNYSASQKNLKPTPVVSFEVFNLKWSDNVSNSHYAPVSGVTNFSQKDNLPKNYSGWIGRFDYVVQSNKNQLSSYPGSSEMWRNTRIHSGTGGGGGHKNQEENFLQSFGYGFRLFASDWPAMAREYEKARVFHILKGTIDEVNLDDYVNRSNPAEKYLEVPSIDELCV